MLRFWKRAADAARSGVASCRPGHIIIAGGLLVIAAIQISAGLMMYRSRNVTIAAEQRDLINIATILADQLNRVFSTAVAVQLNLLAEFRSREFTSSADFEQRQSDQSTHLRLKNHANNLPQLAFIALINSQGKMFNSSRAWPAQELDVSDRDYFTALQTDAQIASFVGHPATRRTGNSWVVHIAHRVSGPNGELIGVVTAAIDLQYISRLFERISLGSETSIAHYLMDGTLLARHPHVESAIGKIASPNMPFKTILANAHRGSSRIEGVFDGKERIIAAHRVGNYPFAVTATDTTESVLTEWRRTTAYVAVIVLAITLLIAAVMWLSVRQLNDREFMLRERAKDDENQIVGETMRQLDLAISHLSQGISMFDAGQRLVLSNKRYAELYRFTPEQVKPGTALSQIADYHIAAGTFSGDSPEQYKSRMLAGAEQRISAASRASDTSVNGVASATLWDRLEIEIKDGRTIAIVNHPTPDGGWIATHEDITRHRALNNERDRSLTLIAAIVENIPVAIFVKEAAEFRYLLFNRAGEAWYRVPRDKAIGATAHQLLSKEHADRVVAQDREFMASPEKTSTIEHVVRTKNGDDKLVRLKRVKIGGNAGQVDYILGIVEDLTAHQGRDETRPSRTAKPERAISPS
jgi:PAS domain S-box-containing protein